MAERRSRRSSGWSLPILVHVTEHFSYHVGELTYLTKLLTNRDTAYYDPARLRARNAPG